LGFLLKGSQLARAARFLVRFLPRLGPIAAMQPAFPFQMAKLPWKSGTTPCSDSNSAWWCSSVNTTLGQCGCGMVEGDASPLVCDHKTLHRGDERLFWDETNLQSLLKSCHYRAKWKAEQASLIQRGVWYRRPSECEG
jgi:hypothetical protein